MTFPSCNSVTGHASGWFFQYPNPNTHPAGVADGDTLGLTLGVADGDTLGLTLGVADGDTLGLTLGVTDGDTLGLTLGVADGVTLGLTLGVADGVTLGLEVGVGVGLPSARAVSTVLVFPVTPSNPATTIRRFPIAVPPVKACGTFVFAPLVHVSLGIS